MKRFKCDIVDGKLLVERIPGKSYYWKFTLDWGEVCRGPKRAVIVTDYRVIYNITMTYSYYPEPLNLRGKISNKNLEFLLKCAKV